MEIYDAIADVVFIVPLDRIYQIAVPPGSPRP